MNYYKVLSFDHRRARHEANISIFWKKTTSRKWLSYRKVCFFSPFIVMSFSASIDQLQNWETTPKTLFFRWEAERHIKKKKKWPADRVRVCGGSLFSRLHLLNPTRTNCPAACQRWVKWIQWGGRELDRGDKELPQICDLSCHTLTYKGNPGGDTHTHTHKAGYIRYSLW